ncbi:hypothetical protein BT63DRAFT_423582 [Microthyrium microscopicum]|uniref:Uncharacterized protein n=1 Tax=Microthyrium microscopicum TaxID=703497 RepID=A0A6A6UKG0_9PEZI|nr:hypothetical protein BT63DRAFT_423582 [Microthyrium microscopicum]
MDPAISQSVKLPRVAIEYCTQCRWMLRAAYFGQELLSTFGTSIGEIALIPTTGGIFTVHLTYAAPTLSSSDVTQQTVLLWDRKSEGGFPETKVLKQRVRDHIDPSKNLGHSDVHGKNTNAMPPAKSASSSAAVEESAVNTSVGAQISGSTSTQSGTECEDCKK